MARSWMDAATLGIKYSADIIIKRLERIDRDRTVFRAPTWLRSPDMEPGLLITEKFELHGSASEHGATACFQTWNCSRERD
jgi:hypothetical protein